MAGYKMTKKEELRLERIITEAMIADGMPEYWFTHPDSENYERSTLGRVRRAAPGRGAVVGRVLKPYATEGQPKGQVSLFEHGKRVAQPYVAYPDDYTTE